MSQIFLSHSSRNNDSAVALRDWLVAQGWDDVFLDLDPHRGVAAGERWERSLNQAASRCEAVLFLVSRAWLASDWCVKEFHLANRLNKRLFGVLIEDIPIVDLPSTLTGTWQLMSLTSGRDHIMLRALLPGSQDEVHVTFSREGLTRLRVGLERAGLDARFFAWPPENDPKRPPYRGLLPLEGADAGIFFGREAAIIEALDRIRGMKDGAAPRLLVLLGASGAGKSSFLRAGLLPRLVRDDRNYLTLPVIRPERAAFNGEAGLLRALATAFDTYGLVIPRAEIRQAIKGGAATLRPLLQILIARVQATFVADDANTKAPVLVLAIDQGEELFLSDGSVESTALLNLLREWLADDAPAVLVVIAIRSDAYERLQTAKILQGVTQQTLSLTPMPPGAYQAVIEGPAARLKDTERPLVIEPALTQALLSEIEEGGGRDALPLLAFTLERLYLEYGARRRLSLKDYNALGRIKGSIEAAVERAFIAADTDARIPRHREARLALLRRGLIPCLAGIDPDTGSPRRQKARISDIPEDARLLIDLLVEQRLLSADVAEDTRERTIEPAHESLLRQWGSLQGWLQEDFAALTTLETIKRAARDWAANAKREDWLVHRAGRLEEGERLLERTDLAGNLSLNERSYLLVCRQREDVERREKTASLERRLKLTRRFNIAAVLAAAIMAGVGFYAFAQKSKADLATASVILAKEAAEGATEKATLSLEQAEHNLKQAKVKESHFLSRESTLAIANNDPVTAIGLALEALPKGNGDDTPYVADAEFALFMGIFQIRERRIFSGHDAPVLSVAFSPDSTRIVTASDDKTARLWDAATGAQLALLKGHDRVISAVFSPDGTRVVTESADNTARVWDAITGTQVALLKGHGGRVRGAIFNPDGTRVATFSEDHTVRIWNSTTGALIAVLEGHGDLIFSLAFSPDGARIVTGSVDRTARVWDAATGSQMLLLEWHDNTVLAVAFSPDGASIVTASADATARVWNAVTGAPTTLLLGHEGPITSATFSPDGTRIVTSSYDTTARVWDTVTGAQTALLKGHEGTVPSAAFSPDGKRIVTASWDDTARIWDTASGAQMAVLKGHERGVLSANFSPDGKRIVTGSYDKTARVWDTVSSASSAQIVLFRGKFNTAQVAVSPDGRRIAVAYFNSPAGVWDLATGAEIALFNGYEKNIKKAVFSPDSTRIVTASDDKTARVWDAATGAQLALLKHDAPVLSAAFSPDGARIVTTSSDKTARVWDAATGAQLALLKGHEDSVYSATFSTDNTRIISASVDKTARVWDAATGAQLALLKHDAPVLSAAFSPDGARIVTTSSDKTARVWNAGTGSQLALLKGHEDTVSSAAFNLNGTRIVTASRDATARIWDATTGAQIGLLNGQERYLLSAAFSADDAHIVIASLEGPVRKWDVPGNLDKLIEASRNRVPRCLTTQQRERYFLPIEIPNWCYEMSKWPLKPP
jgi:WD40 repeat protein